MKRAPTRITSADIAAIGAVLGMASTAMGQATESEPNDTESTAQTIDGSPGRVEVSANLEETDGDGYGGGYDPTPGDVDFFRFTGLEPFEFYTAQTVDAGGSVDTVLGIGNGYGGFALIDDESGSDFGSFSGISFLSDGAGEAIVAVSGSRDCDFDGLDGGDNHFRTGDYGLILRFGGDERDDDGENQTFPGQTIAGSRDGAFFNSELFGEFDDPDGDGYGGGYGTVEDVDFYALTGLAANTTYRVEVTPEFDADFCGSGYGPAFLLRLGVFDDTGALLSSAPADDQSLTADLDVTSDASGELRIAIADRGDSDFAGDFGDVSPFDRIPYLVTIVSLAQGCNPADIAAPFGVVDGADVNAFITAFGSSAEPADIAAPFGVVDGADVNAFITAFGQGCP